MRIQMLNVRRRLRWQRTNKGVLGDKDKLFDNQRALDENSRHMPMLGLDMEKFKKDFVDPELRKTIANQGDFAARWARVPRIPHQWQLGFAGVVGTASGVSREVNKVATESWAVRREDREVSQRRTPRIRKLSNGF